jgi:hypothetical protein
MPPVDPAPLPIVAIPAVAYPAVNSTVGLTLLLLALMCAAGAASTSWGFNLGREALKGITQPDFRPTADRSTNSRPEPASPQFLKESDIIGRIEKQIAGVSPAPGTAAAPEVAATPSPAASPEPSPAGTVDSVPGRLPQAVTVEGVTMTVAGVRRSGSSLLLDVQLRNGGTRPVQFLYAFLEVTDDFGQVVTSLTEGLPTDLPADGSTARGTISVPVVLLDGVQLLNLTLTDYPDRELQLDLYGIPVNGNGA